MTHQAFVRDIIAITRAIELPDECPKCHAEFGPGTTNIKCWHLRPYFDKVRLTKVFACGKPEDVVETLQTTQHSIVEPWTRLPAIFKCAKCSHTLAKYHIRLYDLQEMSQADAFKLQGLLYDYNVLDPEVQAKVWANDFGDKDCSACIIEAALGTEEVPHPIDPRVHTCVRNSDELKG